MSAVFITLGGVFAWALVIAVFGPEPDMGAIGVGQALGLGMVATLAARNVPDPQRERLGLCGFDIALMPTLLLLLPVVVASVAWLILQLLLLLEVPRVELLLLLRRRRRR